MDDGYTKVLFMKYGHTYLLVMSKLDLRIMHKKPKVWADLNMGPFFFFDSGTYFRVSSLCLTYA